MKIGVPFPRTPQQLWTFFFLVPLIKESPFSQSEVSLIIFLIVSLISVLLLWLFSIRRHPRGARGVMTKRWPQHRTKREAALFGLPPFSRYREGGGHALARSLFPPRLFSQGAVKSSIQQNGKLRRCLGKEGVENKILSTPPPLLAGERKQLKKIGLPSWFSKLGPSFVYLTLFSYFNFSLHVTLLFYWNAISDQREGGDIVRLCWRQWRWFVVISDRVIYYYCSVRVVVLPVPVDNNKISNMKKLLRSVWTRLGGWAERKALST